MRSELREVCTAAQLHTGDNHKKTHAHITKSSTFPPCCVRDKANSAGFCRSLGAVDVSVKHNDAPVMVWGHGGWLEGQCPHVTLLGRKCELGCVRFVCVTRACPIVLELTPSYYDARSRSPVFMGPDHIFQGNQS